MKLISLGKILVVSALLAGATALHATNYYIDSVNGKDNHSGLTSDQAWQNINTASGRFGTAQYPVNPGDQIELANGSSWNGSLCLTNVSGASGNNILIQNYTPAGGNLTPPVIDASGFYCGVGLNNCSCITVQGLTITGHNHPSIGVFITITNHSPSPPYISSGIVVRNLTINNLALATTPHSPTGNGIYVNYNGSINNMVNNLTIQDCTFTNMGQYAVAIDPPWWTPNWPSYYHPWATNILVNHIQVSGGYDGFFAHDSQSVTLTNSTCTGAELCWMENCEYFLVHGCTGSGATNPTDGTGVHIDNNNAYVTIEDCRFKNNSGGFVEILTNNYNCCYRYNVSVDDGARVIGQNGGRQNGKSLWIGENCRNIYIYNNQISVGDFVSNISFQTNLTGVVMVNNIFNYAGGTTDDSQFHNHPLTNNFNGCVVSNNSYLPGHLVAGLTDGRPVFNTPVFQSDSRANWAFSPNFVEAGLVVPLAPSDNGRWPNVAGGPPGVYTGFNQPATDPWGHLRDLTKPSIGAYELHRPSPPTGLTATAGDRSVTLVCNPSPGAETYALFMATTAGGPYAPAGNAVGTTFSCNGTPGQPLINGTTYYFVVAALNIIGPSDYSAEVSATPKTKPSPPSGLHIINSN